MEILIVLATVLVAFGAFALFITRDEGEDAPSGSGGGRRDPAVDHVVR
jgi:hypothetical protein